MSNIINYRTLAQNKIMRGTFMCTFLIFLIGFLLLKHFTLPSGAFVIMSVLYWTTGYFVAVIILTFRFFNNHDVLLAEEIQKEANRSYYDSE